MALSSPIYRQYQSNNVSKKILFHAQIIPESTDPSNRDTSKDRHTNTIPIPSIKHPTSFTVSCKNDSNIMVERDSSIVCQQNSKEPETKKQKNNNHQTNNLT